jgi:hypothetical protein
MHDHVYRQYDIGKGWRTPSVAKGPKFRQQNTQGVEKYCVGPVKSGAEFLADESKKGHKEATFF